MSATRSRYPPWYPAPASPPTPTSCPAPPPPGAATPPAAARRRADARPVRHRPATRATGQPPPLPDARASAAQLVSAASGVTSSRANTRGRPTNPGNTLVVIPIRRRANGSASVRSPASTAPASAGTFRSIGAPVSGSSSNSHDDCVQSPNARATRSASPTRSRVPRTGASFATSARNSAGPLRCAIGAQRRARSSRSPSWTWPRGNVSAPRRAAMILWASASNPVSRAAAASATSRSTRSQGFRKRVMPNFQHRAAKSPPRPQLAQQKPPVALRRARQNRRETR